MALIDLDGQPAEGVLPQDVKRFLREADRRIERFQIAGNVTAFVPSDYSAAYLLLKRLLDENIGRGVRFCEWGSGFGVVASLAAWLGFDACGIEADGELVNRARELAEDFNLDTEFTHGSFIPRGAENRVHTTGSYSWLTTESDYAYDDLGDDIKDMDIIYAYPWPDEEAVTATLFDRYAGAGAILITYHSEECFRVRRKRKSKK